MRTKLAYHEAHKKRDVMENFCIINKLPGLRAIDSFTGTPTKVADNYNKNPENKEIIRR